MHMTNTNVIVAQRTNEQAILALSSFIHALFELDCYAVARLVTKDNKPPLVVLLAPAIEPDYECLLEVQLPFAEDVRSYRFPPLDKVVTVSGKVVTEHRNLPNDKLMDAMSKYVDSMELQTRDENGWASLLCFPLAPKYCNLHVHREPTDTLPIEDSYSPLLHRLDSAIRYRAIHPTDPVPEPSKRLIKFSQPPEDLVKNSKAYLEKLIAAADVKKGKPTLPSVSNSEHERGSTPSIFAS